MATDTDITDQLRDEHGVTSLDEAIARRDQLAAQIADVGAQIREQIADVQRLLDDGAAS